MAAVPARILPVIVLSQFAGTSLWFAGNAVVEDLVREVGLGPHAVGDLTSAVQLGFIVGTLVFAVLSLADRVSPVRVFFACSLSGALCNLGLFAPDPATLLASRFATGFFLAGIYPVGMKIAAGWYQQGLGRAIGYLVGALVLGTALPHLLKGLGAGLPWRGVLVSVSVVAAAGGVLMWRLVPDGPHLKHDSRFDPLALVRVFRAPAFRASSFGYFGHMWELYAFWAFVPFALAAQGSSHGVTLDVSLWSFAVIAIGALGCVVGGVLSPTVGSARVARFQLFASGVCCVASPALFHAPTGVFLVFLLFWGVVVVGDSPQFSALNARTAPRDRVGSALTIVNCIGFSITIVSIQLLSRLIGHIPPEWLFLPLALGPVAGLWALRPLITASPESPEH